MNWNMPNRYCLEQKCSKFTLLPVEATPGKGGMGASPNPSPNPNQSLAGVCPRRAVAESPIPIPLEASSLSPRTEHSPIPIPSEASSPAWEASSPSSLMERAPIPIPNPSEASSPAWAWGASSQSCPTERAPGGVRRRIRIPTSASAPGRAPAVAEAWTSSASAFLLLLLLLHHHLLLPLLLPRCPGVEEEGCRSRSGWARGQDRGSLNQNLEREKILAEQYI